jgi:serine/threonine-protein kinase
MDGDGTGRESREADAYSDTIPASDPGIRPPDAGSGSAPVARPATPRTPGGLGKADTLLPVGTVIEDKYEVKRLIGSGGMGAVYEGFHRLITRRVAIKVLHPDITDDHGVTTRFLNEARIAAELGCENIIEVTDMGVLPNQAPYLVMEYLEGETLGQRIEREGSLPEAEAIEIITAVLAGLAAVHRAGVIHRDLKPENVFLARRQTADGETREVVKLLDFGVSKIVRQDGDGLHLTQTGAVVGTPSYMSPEQARGARDADHRIDIYAAGLLLYEALTGERPFQADNYNALMFLLFTNEPTPPREHCPDLPVELEAVILRALAREPDDRFATALEFLEALAPFAPEAVNEALGGAPRSSANRSSASTSGVRRSAARVSVDTFPEKVKRRRRAWLVVSVVAVLVTGGVIAAIATSRDEPGSDRSREGREDTAGAGPSPVATIDAGASPGAAPDPGFEADAGAAAVPGDAAAAGDARPPDAGADGEVTDHSQGDHPQDNGRSRRRDKTTSRPKLRRDVPF